MAITCRRVDQLDLVRSPASLEVLERRDVALLNDTGVPLRRPVIAAVDPDQPDEVQFSGRSNAYYAALRGAGIPVGERLVVTVDWGGDQGADAMANLLSQPEPPTAVYAHSDEVTLGAIRTLRRGGLRIPDDLSVIGIDDYPVAELTDLTTVRQPVREQGELAGRMLLSILSGEEIERDVVVPTQLVIRGSTAPPRG